MGYNGGQIYRMIHANPAGTQRLDAASDTSRQLSNDYQSLHDEFISSQKTLNEFWRGKGGEAGSAGLNPLVDANIEYMANLGNAHRSMNGMSMSFQSARDSMKPMPEQRPEVTHGAMFHTEGEQEAKEWDEKNRHNINQYQTYQESQELNLDGITTQYTPVRNDISRGKPETEKPETTASSMGGSSSPSLPGGTSQGTGGSYSAPGGSAAPQPAGSAASMPAAGSQPAQSPQPSSPQPAVAQQPPATAAQPPTANWQSPQGDSSTSSAGYTPPPSGGYGQGGFGPAGAYGGNGSPGAAFGPNGSGGGYAGGGYAGGGFGPSGSGGSYGGYGGGSGAYGSSGGGYSSGDFGPRGSAGGGQAPAAGGRSTGAAPPGGGPAPRGYGASPGTGGGSSNYGGRAPMMGAPGAGRGQGGGDEEHENKYVLPHDDPDELFGGIPPGVTVVPPVIGE